MNNWVPWSKVPLSVTRNQNARFGNYAKGRVSFFTGFGQLERTESVKTQAPGLGFLEDR